MIDVKQNRDLIVVYCDTCASTLRVYASGLDESLHECIEGHGWEDKSSTGVVPGVGAWFTNEQTCRACIRKAQGKGRRDG